MESSKEPGRLGPLTVAMAILIAIVWGFNFVVIKVGVADVPPLFLAALRFVFSALPALLFVKRPVVPWKYLAAYGLFLGVGEFGLLFTALKLGAPVGLSSIVLQAQAFFTALLAALFLKERIRRATIIGMVLAAIGLAFIALPGGGAGIASFKPLLALMVLLAAFCWAAANVTARAMPATGALGLMVWSSIFSPLPLLALSLAFEGPGAIAASVMALRPLTLGALAYLVVLSTLVGYGLWNSLIMCHGALRIAPFSLLVPLFSLTSAALFLGERFTLLDAGAGLLILVGLLVHVLGRR